MIDPEIVIEAVSNDGIGTYQDNLSRHHAPT
jgi:hypothetical protein